MLNYKPILNFNGYASFKDYNEHVKNHAIAEGEEKLRKLKADETAKKTELLSEQSNKKKMMREEIEALREENERLTGWRQIQATK